MKKVHKKILGGLILLTSVITIMHMGYSVKAEDNNPYEEGPLEDMSREQCTTLVGKSRYDPRVNSIESEDSRSYYVKTTRGIFDIYIYEIKNDGNGNEWPELVNTLVFQGRDTKDATDPGQLVILPQGNVPKQYEIVFSLKQADERCGVTENSKPVRNNSNGIWTLENNAMGYLYSHYVEVPASIGVVYVNNIHYNGICSAFRNRTYAPYASQFGSVGLIEKDFNDYINDIDVQNGLPYCYSTSVTSNPKEIDVAMMIKNVIMSKKLPTSAGQITFPPISADEILLGKDDSTDFSNNPLQCPAYQTINGSTMPNQSYTINKYRKTTEDENEFPVYTTTDEQPICKTTCTEMLTVTYGPPVATKAGLCFEYKVKVESELQCTADFTDDGPDPSDYTVCTPVGGCNGGSYRSASGPNEDFDSCVNSCDGGKYTQNCIDSCYNEVYGSQTSLPLSYNNIVGVLESATYKDSKVEKMADETENKCNIADNDFCTKLLSGHEDCANEDLKSSENILQCANANNTGPGKTYSYEEIRNALTESGTGYYKVKNSGTSNASIEWNHGNERYFERPGRYYTMSITEYTVGRLKSAGRRNNSYGGQDGLSVVDSVGFLRNNYGTSVCGAACYWMGCNDAKNNGYYTTDYKGTPESAGDATNREFLNQQDATAVYKEEYAKWEAARRECMASASCTTQVSEFTISVNNKTKDEPEVDNWINYQSTITESGNQTATTYNGISLGDPDKVSMILDQSGCYNPDESNGNAKYMTEWSFPGTWVNNKTGKISYQPAKDNAWHLKKEKFCTNLNSAYVNTEWWTHRIAYSGTHFSEDAQAAIEEYNIVATAKDFGYFKWDFNIQCFYALSDVSTPGGTPSANPEEIDALSYKARTIDLSDMFPNSENETTTENPNETGREQGYNWTDGASNVKNTDYEITPGALYPVIQARGEDIYNPSNAETYLDYEFYLTPSDLNKIRNYSKDAGSFSNYDSGKITVANGIAYYESGLFRSSSTSSYKLGSESIITLGALGVNNQKSKGSNEAEVFTNSYTTSLIQSRDEYLSYISGGNTNE